MTRAQYLNLTYNIGMSRKDAMLSEISTVNEICELRAEAVDKARRKHGGN